MLITPTNIKHASKADKKAVMRFYKQQHYSSRFMGFDDCYFISNSNTIIACVIFSKIKQENNVGLLHALVVDKAFQGHGLASLLLKHLQKQHKHVACFFAETLTPLYLKNAFKILDEASIASLLPSDLYGRYYQYKTTQQSLIVGYWSSPPLVIRSAI